MRIILLKENVTKVKIVIVFVISILFLHFKKQSLQSRFNQNMINQFRLIFSGYSHQKEQKPDPVASLSV